MQALLAGEKLSLQTTGALTLIILPGIILQALCPQLKIMNIIRQLLASIVIFITVLASVARIPYFEQFHSSYNQMLFTAFHEDIYALYISMSHGFNLFPRLLAVIIITGIIIYIYEKYLSWSCAAIISKISVYLLLPLSLVILCLISILSLYGGGLSWRTGTNWENAGITSDKLLNESILDEYQAVYRAYVNQSRMLACNGLAFTPEDVKQLAQELTHKDGGNNLAIYLAKTAPGPQIPKPDHIFIILSESYANWPYLEKYAKLPLTQHMHKLIQGPNSYYMGNLLPAGSSTVGALMTMTTGLANANLYLTTMPKALEKPYLTATAPQFAKLGYHTNFWYAGPDTWENIREFTLAQGFQSFYGRGDLDPEATGSVWGADDKYLYQKILQDTTAQPSFNIILNVSNHSPFTVNLDKENYPRSDIIKNLPKDKQNDEELIKELGHYWYSDKELYAFITAMQAKYPNSLFIIMGDHADRYNIQTTPSKFERYAIPLIILGNGISTKLFPGDAAGSQLDILPTIMNLIAPKGFQYYSIGQSLQQNKLGENYGFWITANALGTLDELLNNVDVFGQKQLPTKEQLEQYINAVRAISWYLGSTNKEIIE